MLLPAMLFDLEYELNSFVKLGEEKNGLGILTSV